MTQSELFHVDRTISTPTKPQVVTDPQVNLISDHKALVRQIWNKLWSNGFANPITAIEQLSYLIFMRLLDEEESRRETSRKQSQNSVTQPKLIFTDAHQRLRWSSFKHVDDSRELGRIVREAFGYIRRLDGVGGAYLKHMRGANFLLSPEGAETSLLGDLIRLIDQFRFDTRGQGIDQENLSDLGDLYEFMLNQLTSSGKNGQFRTPRHIINMIVEMMAPSPVATRKNSHYRVCDPSCGTGGFLVSMISYLKKLKITTEDNIEMRWIDQRDHAQLLDQMFIGYDFDATMLRIASMNLMLHGSLRPTIEGVNSVSQRASLERDLYESVDLILANPPFEGSVDMGEVSHDLLKLLGKRVPKTQPKNRRLNVKTELLFLALILQMLKEGGRAAVIVPDGVLFGSSKAHQKLRKVLVEDHRLEAVISMPSGVFKPYASVSTAVLILTKTSRERTGTDQVWFYRLEADGFSLDDKRKPIEDNDIPDLKAQWSELKRRELAGEELTGGSRTSKAFFVSRHELNRHGYDLSMNRYREMIYEEIEYEDPQVILQRLQDLEDEIIIDLAELKEMLG